MGVAELSGSRTLARQRFVGITTVFGGDGTYLLGSVSRECSYDDYAETIRHSMLAILEDVRARNNWQPGDTVRVIFHAHKPLKRDEVAGIVFACANCDGVPGGELNPDTVWITSAGRGQINPKIRIADIIALIGNSCGNSSNVC